MPNVRFPRTAGLQQYISAIGVRGNRFVSGKLLPALVEEEWPLNEVHDKTMDSRSQPIEPDQRLMRLLGKLSECPGPAGYEHDIADLVAAELKPYCDSIALTRWATVSRNEPAWSRGSAAKALSRM